jgi:hypothetical protein
VVPHDWHGVDRRCLALLPRCSAAPPCAPTSASTPSPPKRARSAPRAPRATRSATGCAPPDLPPADSAAPVPRHSNPLVRSFVLACTNYIMQSSMTPCPDESGSVLDPPAGATAGLSPHHRRSAVAKRFGSRAPHAPPRSPTLPLLLLLLLVSGGQRPSALATASPRARRAQRSGWSVARTSIPPPAHGSRALGADDLPSCAWPRPAPRLGRRRGATCRPRGAERLPW